MAEIKSAETSYNDLLENLKREINEGLCRAQNAYDKEKVLTYWKIGQTLNTYFLENKIQGSYSKRILKNLSQDLNIGETLLYQIRQFYKTYPAIIPDLNLKWAHYRALVKIKDEDLRTSLEEKVSSENLSKRDIEVLIKTKTPTAKTSKPNPPKIVSTPKPLRTVKGKLYTYGIYKPEISENYFIDLGFYISQESNITQAKGSFIESIKTESAYEMKSIPAAKKDLYTYKAYVLKIIDGDTMWLNIDLGFKTWIYHKIRLRGIGTPEIRTTQGQEACQYVKAALKRLPFVIVKSHGRDKFDRYLMDVYYLPNETDPQKVLENGRFLNQELLSNNLATVYED